MSKFLVAFSAPTMHYMNDKDFYTEVYEIEVNKNDLSIEKEKLLRKFCISHNVALNDAFELWTLKVKQPVK